VGDWKLVADAGKPWELYDLKTDRAEQHDLAAAMPEKAKELERTWQAETDRFTELVKTSRARAVPGSSAKPRPR
jgi:arylsulfatase